MADARTLAGLAGVWNGDDDTDRFRDRRDAGARLAQALAQYKAQHPLVLGIPRGGVVVAAEVARALDGELDVLVSRKLGSPYSPELAIGAVTADGGRYLAKSVIDDLGVSSAYIERVTAEQMAEAKRREQRFRGGRPPLHVVGRVVILVDDGLATGSTMFAAVQSLRGRKPTRLVVAVPVGSREALDALRPLADEVVCVSRPDPLFAIGFYYEDFGQTEDEEVERLLKEAPAVAAAPS